MSAQPVQTRPPHRPERQLRVLPVPDTEPPPVDLRQLAQLDRAVIQETLTMDFGGPRRAPTAGGPSATLPSRLPDPQAWASSMVRMILETIDGMRPSSQLRRWVSLPLHEQLSRRCTAARQRRQRRDHPPVVRATTVCHPKDQIAEVSAVVQYAGRARALAMQLSGLDGRWVVTAFELG